MDAQKIEETPSVSYAMLAKHLGPNGANMLSRTVWKDGIDIEVPDEGIQTLCKEYAAKTLASKEAELVRLLGALDKIAQWELPETGEVWPAGNPVSYETVYGSNGARDYMRAIARNAITQPPKEPT